MEFKVVELERAAGKLLAHNVVDDAGRKVLRKGTPIGIEELDQLRKLGHSRIWIAELAPDDVPEDEVAQRLAEAVSGRGLEVSSLSTGRANLRSTLAGILKVKVNTLRHVNSIAGFAIATRSNNDVVAVGDMVATVKVVPYAVPRADVEIAEKAAHEVGGVLFVHPFEAMKVGVLLSGDQASEDRLRRVYGQAIRERVVETGAQIVAERFVAEETTAIAGSIRDLLTHGADMIVVAGATSIADADDITPRAVRDAGGVIEIYGAPVDPGNLLMLAYVGDVPILGVPGCVRSRGANVVNLVLPRLLAGERLTRDDIVELGHGGLMK